MREEDAKYDTGDRILVSGPDFVLDCQISQRDRFGSQLHYGLVYSDLGSGANWGNGWFPVAILDRMNTRKLRPGERIFVPGSYADTIEFAENLGWKDEGPEGEEWNSREADALEDAALDFIKGSGYTIIQNEELAS